jgi:hypothetical protein
MKTFVGISVGIVKTFLLLDRECVKFAGMMLRG